MMINTEGEITYHTIGNSRCIPRRRQYQSKRIPDRRLLYLDITRDKIIEERRGNMEKQWINEHRL